MNEQPEKQIKSETPEVASLPRTPSRRTALVIAVAAIAIVVVAIAAWLLWPKQAGKPVAAPRSVSFDESPKPATAGGEKLTLTPEQMRTVQLKIETVGERPSSEASGQSGNRRGQANTYKETPVVSLVGGITRSVGAELGQNVRRGQRVAVVFSNELADAQSRYLTALATLDEHHRHHLRTIKLVEIGAASRQDLEMATSQYREAESNLANLRQKLLLLGMTAQPNRLAEFDITD